MVIDRLLGPSHIWVGILTVAAFLGTGLYMLGNFPDIYQATEVIRYQFRANHIYILFSALLNIGLGLYVVPSQVSSRRILQRIGSFLLLFGPAVLLTAFFIEPRVASPDRPLTFFGVVFCLAGVGLHLFGTFRFRRQVPSL